MAVAELLPLHRRPARSGAFACRLVTLALIALAVTAAGMLAPGGAYASTATWNLPAAALSAVASSTLGAQVAVAPDGTTTAVWMETNPDDPSLSVIMAAARPAGQTAFGAPERISGPNLGSFALPRIAVGPDGTTVVVWRDLGNDQLLATTRAAGQSRFPATSPQLVYSESGFVMESHEVVAGADGSFTLAWGVYDASEWPAPTYPNPFRRKALVATRLAGETAFAAAEVLVPLARYYLLAPQLAAAPDGSIVAVWSLYNPATLSGGIQAATRAPGRRAFGDPEDLSLLSAIDARIAIGQDGRATAVWTLAAAERIQSATRAPGAGAFAPPVDVPSGEVIPGAGPQLVVAPDGEATVIWNKGLASIASSTRAPGASTWGAERVAWAPDGTTGARDPSVAVAYDGRVTVVWVDRANSAATTRILSATRASGAAAWSSATPIDAAAGGWSTGRPAPAVATAPDGSTTAVWDGVIDPDLVGSTPNMVIKSASTDPTAYSLDVAVSGAGSGTVVSSPAGIDCGSACAATLVRTTAVVLTARAAAGSSFTGWSGACSGTSTTCTVTMLGDRSATAAFAKDPVPPARLRVRASRVRNGRLVTTGAVPSGATRVEQTVVRLGPVASRGAGDPRRVATRTVRCPITTEDGKRSFRCSITLDPGRWRVTTTALAATAPVARSVRVVAVRRGTPEPVTG